jgi:hypothetical protein
LQIALIGEVAEPLLSSQKLCLCYEAACAHSRASAMSLCYEAMRPCNARRLCAWEERVWAWSSGNSRPTMMQARWSSDMPAASLPSFLRHTASSSTDRSDARRRITPRWAAAIWTTSPHRSKGNIFSRDKIFSTLNLSRSLPATLPAGPTAPWARTTSAKGATGAGACQWWARGTTLLHGACPPTKGRSLWRAVRAITGTVA